MLELELEACSSLLSQWVWLLPFLSENPTTPTQMVSEVMAHLCSHGALPLKPIGLLAKRWKIRWQWFRLDSWHWLLAHFHSSSGTNDSMSPVFEVFETATLLMRSGCQKRDKSHTKIVLKQRSPGTPFPCQQASVTAFR